MIFLIFLIFHLHFLSVFFKFVFEFKQNKTDHFTSCFTCMTIIHRLHSKSEIDTIVNKLPLSLHNSCAGQLQGEEMAQRGQ